jgi:PHS family inorganic phosphate transporter-like MFS transporter
VLFRTAISSLIIASISLPGYWLSIALIDIWGRRPIQLLGKLVASQKYKLTPIGFSFMVLVFGAMGLFYDWLVKQSVLFVVIYGLTFFFSNFGPNSTTFIVPGEVFPAEIRATCHGLSSAAGKVGAILGTKLS